MKSLLLSTAVMAATAICPAQAQEITFSDYRPASVSSTTTQVRCPKTGDAVAGEVRYDQKFDEANGLSYSVSSITFEKKTVAKQHLSEMNQKVGSKSILGVFAECRGSSIRLVFALSGRSTGNAGAAAAAVDSFIVIKEDDGSIQVL